MKSKLVINIFVVYLVILAIVLIWQIPKKNEIIAYEPTSSEIKNEDKLKNAVALYIDSPLALANEKQIFIDDTNPDIAPIIDNNNAYVPVRFLSQAFDATISWESKTKETTIRYNNTAIIFSNDNSQMKVIDNDSEGFEMVEATPKILNERVYLPLREVAKVFEKDIFYDDGLIIISNLKNIFDKEKDLAVINELKNQLNNLPVIGTEDNFRKVMKLPTTSDNIIDNIMGNKLPASYNDEHNGNQNLLSDKTTLLKSFADLKGNKKIKTDEECIYRAKNNMLQIIKALPADKMEVLSEIKLEDNIVINEFYIEKNSIFILASNTDMKKPFSFCFMYDMKDKRKVEQVRQITIEGNFITSHENKKMLYFISSVPALSLADKDNYKPISYVDTIAKEKKILDFNQIHYFTDMANKNYTNIISIDTENLEAKSNIYSYLGSGNNIYFSDDNMYIATCKADENDQSYDKTTNLYKFKIVGDSINYYAHSSIKGTIKNNSYIKESNSYLKVLSANSEYSYTTGEVANKNNLLILDSKLKKISELEDIAPKKEINSVSFIDNRAYVITKEDKAPIYTIDLKDNNAPKYLGELNIPSYCNYSYPYENNYLITFGKNIIQKDGLDYFTSMNITMYDINDIKIPKECFNRKIGVRGTDSEIFINHNTLLFDKQTNIFAFPISVFEETEENKVDETVIGQPTFKGIYVYKIDENSFNLNSKLTYNNNSNAVNGIGEIMAMIQLDDNIYTISDNTIIANSKSNFNEVGRVDLSKKE